MIKDIDAIRKIIEVTVPATAVADAYKKVIELYGKKMRLPGFRQGKTPVDLIKKRFSQDLLDTLKNEIIDLTYQHLVKHSGIKLYEVLKIDVPSLSTEPPRPCLVLITAEVRPTFDLPDYKGIPISLPKTSVTDEKIQATLEHIRNQHATFHPVERPAQKGDHVKVSYEGTTGNQKIEQLLPGKSMYGTQNNTWEEAGANVTWDTGIKAIVDGLIGMKAGDQKTVTTNFPADFPEPALASKSATYELNVHEVNEKTLPELDANLLKDLGVETLDQLKENIQKRLLEHQQQATHNLLRQKISEYLNSKTQLALPETAVQKEVNFMASKYAEQLLKQGLPKSKLESMYYHLATNFRQFAEAHAKIGFILEAIAEKEKIEPTE
ncbi:MAG: trigger factor, partial [Candidatus Paceibacterales bacterium]